MNILNVLAVPRMLGASADSPALTSSVGAGVAILVVWLLTRYRESLQT